MSDYLTSPLDIALDQETTLLLTGVDAADNPSLTGVTRPVWTVEPTNVLSLATAADGFSASIKPSAQGTARVSVTATDASGSVLKSTVFEVVVGPGTATSLAIVSLKPVKPAPAASATPAVA